MPSRRNTIPTVIPMAATLTQGSSMHMKPAAVKIIPRAKTQPQDLTPREHKSKALTNFEIPENISQSVNKSGNESKVNHRLNKRNSDIITVRIPSSSSQPEPGSTPFVAANTIISAIPAININKPSIKPTDITATS